MTSDPGQPAQTFASIGIDIGKDVFRGRGLVQDEFPSATNRRAPSANTESGSKKIKVKILKIFNLHQLAS